MPGTFLKLGQAEGNVKDSALAAMITLNHLPTLTDYTEVKILTLSGPSSSSSFILYLDLYLSSTMLGFHNSSSIQMWISFQSPPQRGIFKNGNGLKCKITDLYNNSNSIANDCVLWIYVCMCINNFPFEEKKCS